MKQTQLQKEELIKMLTEIYDQLEELEEAIDSNLTDYRDHWRKEQSTKLTDCESRINTLELEVNKVSHKEQDRPNRNVRNHNRAMKLELGY